MSRGFGVGAGLDPELAAELARSCEELGYDSLWSNDHAAVGPPSGDGLATLAALARGSDTTSLGVGALTLDRHSPGAIAAAIERHGLDPGRLVLAIGAGRAPQPLRLLREALPSLREALPGVRLLLAALGPRACELGGAAWDGVLAAWMTPPMLAVAREHVAAGAAAASRPAPPLLAYVRASAGADAETRLAREEGFYRALGGGWPRHFAQLRSDPGRTGVLADYPSEIGPGLAPYETELDGLVVRGLAAARLPALERIAAAAAPRPPAQLPGPPRASSASSSASLETTAPNAK